MNWEAGVWHNVTYEIVRVPEFLESFFRTDCRKVFGTSVAFWHSTGSDPLTLTVSAVSASASSNGSDWHLGVLELPVSGQADSTEDFYFSGVYIESGSLTKTVAGPAPAAAKSRARRGTE